MFISNSSNTIQFHAASQNGIVIMETFIKQNELIDRVNDGQKLASLIEQYFRFERIKFNGIQVRFFYHTVRSDLPCDFSITQNC